MFLSATLFVKACRLLWRIRAAPTVTGSLVRLSVWQVRRFLMDRLITWGAAATDGGCRLVAAATVWRCGGGGTLLWGAPSFVYVRLRLLCRAFCSRPAYWRGLRRLMTCVPVWRVSSGIVWRVRRHRHDTAYGWCLCLHLFFYLCWFYHFVECYILSVRVRFI